MEHKPTYSKNGVHWWDADAGEPEFTNPGRRIIRVPQMGFVAEPGMECVLATTSVSRQLIDDAYGGTEALAEIAASAIAGQVKRTTIEIIRQRRGQ